MITVSLVNEFGVTTREVQWLTEDGALMQATVWSQCFPDCFVYIDGEKFYNGGWEAEV